MSLEQDWKQINEGSDDDLSSLLRPGQLNKLHSLSPLQKIKRHLFINMCWSIAVALLYIVIMVEFPLWPVLLTIGITQAFTIWAIYTAWHQYKNIAPFAGNSLSLLAEMERHYHGMNKWIKLQKKVAIIIYPISATGGYMIGGIVGSGKTIEQFFSKPIVIIALALVILILVPCCVYLTKWMFNKSFGKHLAALKKNIEELKAEK